MTDLATRLKAEGVAVQFRTREGQVQGISYAVDGVAFPGYKLGKAYSFTGLQKHLGVSHSPNQDEQLRQVSGMTADQCREWLQRQIRQVQEQMYRESVQDQLRASGQKQGLDRTTTTTSSSQQSLKGRWGGRRRQGSTSTSRSRC